LTIKFDQFALKNLGLIREKSGKSRAVFGKNLENLGPYSGEIWEISGYLARKNQRPPGPLL
jgi:hypothetical protein